MDSSTAVLIFLKEDVKASLCCLDEKLMTPSDLTENLPLKSAHEFMVLITQATSEGSGEPAHARSLARAFTVHTHEVWK